VSAQTTEANNTFELDVTKIRNDARKHMDAGAVTDGNAIDIERLIGVLNEVLATEIVCYLRYSQHAIAATGIDRAQVAAEFTEHASEEMQHALWAAERVSRLMEKILEQEEEHADDLNDLLGN
jgi:bacterioferritin